MTNKSAPIIFLSITTILLCITATFLVFSFDPVQIDIPQTGDVTELVDVDYTEEGVSVEDGTSVVVTAASNTSIGYWTSDHTGLDKGKIIIMDYANKGKENSNTSDNYITLLKDSGEKIIYRDVDIDLYLNLKVGDIIQ